MPTAGRTTTPRRSSTASPSTRPSRRSTPEGSRCTGSRDDCITPSPLYSGERAGVRGSPLLNPNPLPLLGLRRGSRRGRGRPLTLALSPAYRGEGTGSAAGNLRDLTDVETTPTRLDLPADHRRGPDDRPLGPRQRDRRERAALPGSGLAGEQAVRPRTLRLPRRARPGHPPLHLALPGPRRPGLRDRA